MIKKLQVDPRTPEQKLVDERVAAGKCDGMETEIILTEAAAREILRHRKDLAPTAALSGVLNQPFCWKHDVYRIVRCDYVNGEAVVDVIPANPELQAEVKQRIENNRLHHLNYFQGFGFICFPEDYQKYQE